jgi:hypothetical protein
MLLEYAIFFALVNVSELIWRFMVYKEIKYHIKLSRAVYN